MGDSFRGVVSPTRSGTGARGGIPELREVTGGIPRERGVPTYPGFDRRSLRSNRGPGSTMELREKLGEGGEAEVFAIDGDRVLRRFRRRDHPAIDERIALTREIAAGAGHLPFAVPEILDHHVDGDGRPCFVERRLSGVSMQVALRDVEGQQRTRLLDSYFTTAARLREIELRRDFYGELITPDPLRTETWSHYLAGALVRRTSTTDADDYPEIPDLDAAVADVRTGITAVDDPEPRLVHFDYFPGNVLCDGTRITAVIDWSVLTIAGDPDLDVALALAYFGVTPETTLADVAFGRRWLRERGLTETAHRYERFGAAWWSPNADEPRIRRWVASVLGSGARS